MAGLRKHGVDASPFGSKFKDTSGGYDAGNGKRTYTKPSYTLFVTCIPDAESSDSVAKVFENDLGYLQCRPVGHKSRRMVFVDYGSIDHATLGMQAHQGFKWEDVDVGLKIDYDKDARSKRNTALDEGLFEKFWAIGPRKPKAESDQEMFARLKAEATDDRPTARAPVAVAVPARPKPAILARFQIKGKPAVEQVAEVAPAATADPDTREVRAEGSQALGGLLAYGSDSEEESAEPASKKLKS